MDKAKVKKVTTSVTTRWELNEEDVVQAICNYFELPIGTEIRFESTSYGDFCGVIATHTKSEEQENEC